MVAFRYPTVNRKILTLVCHRLFWMYCLPLESKSTEMQSLHHPEIERQWGVNDFRSCILGNLSADRLPTVITEVLAASIGKRESYTLPAPS